METHSRQLAARLHPTKEGLIRLGREVEAGGGGESVGRSGQFGGGDGGEVDEQRLC